LLAGRVVLRGPDVHAERVNRTQSNTWSSSINYMVDEHISYGLTSQSHLKSKPIDKYRRATQLVMSVQRP
jgi:hypothetical protein